MKIKRIVGFRVIALLMLTALVMMPMVPASASPGIIPGKEHFHCQEGSVRKVSICSYPTDSKVNDTIIPFACKQYYDMMFSPPEDNVSHITIPKESWHSEPYFLKRLGTYGLYIWNQLYAVGDGNGTLGMVNGAISNVNINITVTGNGTGGFKTSLVRWGGPAPAGSAITTMPLNMSVWMTTSQTDPNQGRVHLFEMPFPVETTTGFIKVRINDTAGPYPSGSISMNGYYKNATGVPNNLTTMNGKTVGAGAGLDIYAYIGGIGDVYTDYIFVDYEVLAPEPPPPVGGTWIPVDKLALLAPYIALASAIILAVATTAIFKHRKKQ